MSASSDSTYRLRIMHVSDLHDRGARETERWRRRRVLGEAWDRNLAELLQDGPIDLVCFTGDAADWGTDDEYEATADFITEMMGRLDVDVSRFFCVPGNHDISRPTEKDAWQRMRTALDDGVDEQRISRWMAGLAGPAPGFEAVWREAMLSRQASYRRWIADTLGRNDLDAARSPHRLLGYRATVSIAECPVPVHVIGLDTAWLAGDDNDAGRLRLTEDQAMRLATDEGGNPLTGVRLALMHHPFGMLADGAACRRMLADRVDLVLRGHRHEEEIEQWVSPDQSVLQLAVGSLYEGRGADRWPNGCQVVTVELNDAGRPTKVSVRVRTWSPRGGHWHDDDSLYASSRQGRVSWRVFRPSAQLGGANPFDPWTPVAPDSFLGRATQLHSLENALEIGRSASVIGDWRIGKSSLLAYWAARVEKRGRVVRTASGEGPEGVSHGEFVRYVTGADAPDDPDGAANVLAAWAELVGKPGLVPVIVIDEMDGLLPRLDTRFCERLRGMLDRVSFVLGSRRELDLICEEVGRTSPFHNRLETIWLGLMESDEADALIARGDGLLTPDDVNLLRRWAGRHPFYLQLLGHHLADARRNGQSPADALDRARMNAASRLRELWRVMEVRDREQLLRCKSGIPARRASLRWRGLVTDDGLPFGEVLSEWMIESS